MENIKKHLKQAEEKLRLEWQEKENRIVGDIERTKDEITDLATSGEFSPFAVLDFEKQPLHEASENKNLPELVRIGKLNPMNYSDNIPEIPMLLPFSENAVTFVLNEGDKRNVHTLFELIAFRFMLSLPQDLAKFYFVDNIGGGFARINKIDNKNSDYYRITDNEQDRNGLFSVLEQIVSDFNREHKATYNSLKEYNKTADEMQKPYHFVFIPNFPAGFKIEAAEKLYDFINNGSAAKAGVYIFFSIDENERPKHGVEIERFSQTTTCICQKSNNEYKIDNSIFTGQFNDKFNIALDTSLPSNAEQIIDLINNKEVPKKEVSFEKEYQDRLKEGDFWNKDTINNIKIPIGKINPQKDQFFDFGTKDYFGLIGGLPRMGKTMLLHNIILWGAIEYSPFELEYYLIDCKDGTGFHAYGDLPHTKILSVSNDRQYCANLLAKLVNEMTRRANLFTKASAEKKKQIDKLDVYRKETGEQIPRILAIVDEFQKLFENERIADPIRVALDDIFRRGSAYGINVLLCSQGIKRLYLPDGNITWRLSFQLRDERESENFLGNDGALQLPEQPGNAILNNKRGDKKENINFQVGKIDDIYPYIETLNKAYTEKYPDKKINRFISDGDNNGRIEKNDTLKNNIINNSFQVNDRACKVYIGEPALIRDEHAFVSISERLCSKVILVGDDIKSAISIIGLVNYQLIRQSSEKSKFYIIDCFNIRDEYSKCFDFAKKYFNNQLVIDYAENISSVIDDIEAELQHRIDMEKEGKIVGGRIMLSIACMQNCRDLKKEGYNASSVTKKLVKIINDGAQRGIHVLLYSQTYQGVTDVLETNVLNEFENRIALDSGKSMRIITEQTAAKISEEGSAILQTPDKEPDLIRVYSQFKIDENNKDVDFINELLKTGL